MSELWTTGLLMVASADALLEPRERDTMNEERDSKVRYSEKFRRTEGRQRRRSTLLGILLGSIASIVLLVDGVQAWIGRGMVDMGVRLGFAKYPPSVVIAMGFIGLALCGYCLWFTVTDRRKS